MLLPPPNSPLSSPRPTLPPMR
ncbi:hypothetical protein BN1723_021019, partial [Verticillium longisporum]